MECSNSTVSKTLIANEVTLQFHTSYQGERALLESGDHDLCFFYHINYPYKL